MTGWIKLHRSLVENDLWLAEPFTWGQAWVDLLASANHKPASLFIRSVEIELSRGQIGWSELTMSKRWKWSRGKVRRYLGMLEKRGMIVQQKTPVTTVLTICNYCNYQGNEQQAVQQTVQQEEQQTEQQTDNRRYTNKNEKNEKTNIPVDEIADLFNRSFPELPQVIKLTDARRKAVKGRWADNPTMQGLDRWESFFEYIRKSDFLMGRTDKPWSGLGFDWIMKAGNFIKIVEGNYHNAG